MLPNVSDEVTNLNFLFAAKTSPVPFPFGTELQATMKSDYDTRVKRVPKAR